MTTPWPARWHLGCLAWLMLAGAAATRGQDQFPVPAQPDVLLAARQPLTVGVTTDSFPYGYLNAQGQAIGFSADILDAVARVMNLQIRRSALPGRSLHARFQEGEFDMLQILSQTVERDGFCDFTVPYLTLRGAVFVRRDDDTIRSFGDFHGRKFAIIGARSMGEKFVADQGLKIEVVQASSSEEALRMLARGEVAGTFLSQLTALSVMAERDISNVKLLGEPLSGYDIRHCFAVHKGDALLLARLNEGLAILHRTGEFGVIYHRWFGRVDSPLVTREQAMNYGLALLALGFAGALTAYLRLRTLHRRIATQADELARQQALLRALYDNIPLAVCVLEAAPGGGHRVLLLNRPAAEMFGIQPSPAPGRLLSELTPDPEFKAALQDFLHPAPGAPELRRENRHFPRTNRHLALMRVTLPPAPDGAARCCLLAEDTSDRHRLDEEIAQSRKLRAVGELVGGIAHEFNNLLTPIVLKAGEIEHDHARDRRLIEDIAVISGAARRAAELTRRLLTFGRKEETRPETVRLAAAVDGCFALLRLTIDRRIQWTNAVSADLPPLYLNATDLNQILVNLILNARDTLLDKLAGNPPDWIPHIHVQATQLPWSARQLPPDSSAPPSLGWLRLSVVDNGLGMNPEVRERIFEPFFTTKAVGQGTGLGLATVWHLVQMSGGQVEAESHLGEGTTFHVYLPILPQPSPAVPPPIPALVPTEAAGRILLAEDDDFVAETVTAVLRRAGHTIHREADGLAAWAEIQAAPQAYDLLVLDVNMPGLSGLDLVRRIRESGLYRGPILVMSGRLTSDDMEFLASARVEGVIHKPFAIADFLATVLRCLPAKP